MSSERIRELMAQLRAETQTTEIDGPAREALKQLDADIHRLLDPEDETDESSDLIERAQQLEAEFAASHPGVERFMREVIDALVKIGI